MSFRSSSVAALVAHTGGKAATLPAPLVVVRCTKSGSLACQASKAHVESRSGLLVVVLRAGRMRGRLKARRKRKTQKARRKRKTQMTVVDTDRRTMTL